MKHWDSGWGRALRGVVAFGLLAAGPLVETVQAQWRAWTDGRAMEVKFPAAYTTGTSTVRSRIGTLVFSQASLAGLNGLDLYAYTAPVDRNVSGRMESARERAEETVQQLGGSIISLDMLPADDGWCVQYMAALQGNRRMKGRIYLFDGFISELWVMADIKAISRSEGNAFLDSFSWKLTSRDKLKTLLAATGLQFSADEENDFKIAYRFTEEKRTQVAFVTTFTSPAHDGKVIEIWSPVYQSRGPIPADLANDLLSENSRLSLGNFQTLTFDDGRVLAVFSVVVDMNTTAAKLKTAILHALINADDKESQLDSRDVY